MKKRNIFSRFGFERISDGLNINSKSYNKENVVNNYSNTFSLKKEELLIFESKFSDRNLRILVLGCGAGRTPIALSKLGYVNVVATDFSESMIERAKSNAKNFQIDNIKFHIVDAQDLSIFQDKAFDLVFFPYNGIDYIQTVNGRRDAMSEVYRVLDKNGCFLYSFHNVFWISIYRIFNTIRTIVNGYFLSGYTVEFADGFLITKYSSIFSEAKILKDVGFKEISHININNLSDYIFNYMLYVISRK